MADRPSSHLLADPVAYLRRVGEQPDEAIDIARTALALSALDHPTADLDPYVRHLRELADALGEVGGAAKTPEERQAALSETMARRFDYHGDPMRYDEPQNGDLLRVIDRRKGLPVALGILYISTARAVGWSATGINFPSHFLIRLDGAGGGVMVDPFHDGRALDLRGLRGLLHRMTGSDDLLPDHCLSMDNRDVLLRLMNNLKTRAQKNGDLDRAADLLERMMLIAPGYHFLRRELGLLRTEQGKMIAALSAFEAWRTQTSDGAERREAEALIDRLRRRLH